MNEVSAKIPVYDLSGKVVDNIQLDKKLFDGNVNNALLYEAIKMYEANMRQGTAFTRTRGEVSGGGRKPWRQKGTGRARVGSIRNPIWRHGGTAFGPKPRDFRYSIPKKALNGALLSSLNMRLKEQLVKAVVKIEVKEPKTTLFKKILDNLNIEGKTLIVIDKVSDNVILSSRNIKGILVKEARNINARDVLVNDGVLFEKEAFQSLVERLK